MRSSNQSFAMRSTFRLRPLLLSVLVVALGYFAPRSGSSQELPEEYSFERYLRLQNVSNHIHDRMDEFPLGSDERLALASDALQLRIGLIDYLTAWILSGDMAPQFLRDAVDARLMLYQNVVSIRVELGDCDAAETVANQLDAAAIESGTELALEARVAAWDVFATCEPAESYLSHQSSNALTAAPSSDSSEVPVSSSRQRPFLGPDLATVLGGSLLLSAGYVAALPLQQTNESIYIWYVQHDGETPDDALREFETTAQNQRRTAAVLGGSGALVLAASLWWHRDVQRAVRPGYTVSVLPTLSGVSASVRW